MNEQSKKAIELLADLYERALVEEGKAGRRDVESVQLKLAAFHGACDMCETLFGEEVGHAMVCEGTKIAWGRI